MRGWILWSKMAIYFLQNDTSIGHSVPNFVLKVRVVMKTLLRNMRACHETKYTRMIFYTLPHNDHPSFESLCERHIKDIQAGYLTARGNTQWP